MELEGMAQPLTLARIAAFDEANALTTEASRQILAGNLFQAAARYEHAARVPGLPDTSKKELLLVAAELLLELYAQVRPIRVMH